MVSPFPVALALGLAALAAAHGGHGATHSTRDHPAHTVSRSLPGSWYHADDHPVNALFRRQNADLANDGQTYPQVGSPAWSAAWPVSTPDSNAMPQAWKDALNNAVAAGKIPNIPVSSGPANASPVYPAGNDPNTLPVCSATYKCRLPGDVWDAPAGTVGISFDDGPLPTSDPLYAFLKQNNVQATHFFIGVNIVSNWKEFNTALQNGDDIAVHTWTHPHMTSLSSLDVLAQLAWTMQIIHDSSGGRVPRFWRPPTGDTDARVSAIAKHVLGLTTIVWNQDTEDWSLGQPGGTTPQAIATNLQKWYTGPKSPGLIILEHELSNGSVQAFINAFPLIAQNGWKTMSLAEIDGLNAPYQNAVGSTGAVTSANILANADGASATPSGSSSSASSSSTQSSSSGGSSSSGSSSKSSSGASTSPSTVSGQSGSPNGARALGLPTALVGAAVLAVAALAASA